MIPLYNNIQLEFTFWGCTQQTIEQVWQRHADGSVECETVPFRRHKALKRDP